MTASKRSRAQQRQRLVAVGGDVDVDLVAARAARRSARAVAGVVLDDQHAPAAQRLARQREVRVARARGSRTVTVVPSPSSEEMSIEPVVQLDQRVDDRQPEAGAGAAAAVGAEEAVEGAVDLLGASCRAPGRRRTAATSSPVAPTRTVTRPPSLGVEVRVGEQVGDDLAHARRVGAARRAARARCRRRAPARARRSAGAISAATSRTASATEIGRRWISSWPASTRATSSRSLTRSTSRLVDSRMTSTNSRWRSLSSVEPEQLDEALDRRQRASAARARRWPRTRSWPARAGRARWCRGR